MDKTVDENGKVVSKVLGKGGFGTVYAGIRMKDGAPVAIKSIAKDRVPAWGVVSNLNLFFFSFFLSFRVTPGCFLNLAIL